MRLRQQEVIGEQKIQPRSPAKQLNAGKEVTGASELEAAQQIGGLRRSVEHGRLEAGSSEWWPAAGGSMVNWQRGSWGLRGSRPLWPEAGKWDSEGGGRTKDRHTQREQTIKAGSK